MASQSIQACGHRARQAARHALTPLRRNPVDFIHDTFITNRSEKRQALASARKHRCDEAIVKDEEGRKSSVWTHAKTCPQRNPAPAAPEKQAAA